MKQLPKRMIICIADIRRITGRSQSTAWRMMRTIRKYYNKPPYTLVTMDEFCRFTGYRAEDVREYLE